MKVDQRLRSRLGRATSITGRIALIGDPVAHSVSPAMHKAAFASMGLPLHYAVLRVTRERLTRAFPSLRQGYVGLNVTAPLKEAIVLLMDEVSPESELSGSVNTVVFAADGSARGSSTDGAGFLAALDRASLGLPERALIMGTGGAARAVSAALRARGAFVTVSGRNEEAGRRAPADRFVRPATRSFSHVLAGADLLVNATPVGSWPRVAACPLPAGVTLPPGLVVFDLVYRPRRTALLRLARAAGCRTVQGVEMLIEQAALSVREWTGVDPPIRTMRTAAYQALAAGDAALQEPTPARVSPTGHR